MRLRGTTILLSGGLVLLVLVAIGAGLALAQDRIQNRRVAHTRDVQAAASAVLNGAIDAETAQRGYLLTGDSELRPLVDAGRHSAAAQLVRLHSLVEDNPHQQAAVAAIRPVMRARFVILDETLSLMAADRRGDAIAIVREGRGRAAMDQLRADIGQIIAVEQQLLQQRSAAASNSAATSLILTIAGLALAGVLTAVAIRSLTARTREADDARAEIQILNAGLESTIAERTADLQLANDEIQRFAYIVSHDLRSPLVNIMGFTSELQAVQEILSGFVVTAGAADDASGQAARIAADEDFPEALGFIRASTAKMDRLINAILVLSREGRRVLKPETIDLSALVEEIADSVRHQLDESGATLTADHLPTIVSDRIAIEQVLGNLVENALKYSASDRLPEVHLQGRERGGQVEIEITDNGRGIDPRDHERVFDLFRRSGAQDRPGEGIGLAHVRATIRRLGGTVTLRSELGKGATFVIAVPKIISLTASEKETA